MSTPQGLIDDEGTPVRWKAATVIATAALVVSVVIQIAKAGAKSERLDNLSAKAEKIETRVDRLEGQAAEVAGFRVRQEEIIRRMDSFEKKLDKLLERRSR